MPTFNPSATPVGAIFSTHSESDHFSPIADPGSPSLDYYNGLLTGLPIFTFAPKPIINTTATHVRTCHLSVQSLPMICRLTQNKAKVLTTATSKKSLIMRPSHHTDLTSLHLLPHFSCSGLLGPCTLPASTCSSRGRNPIPTTDP